MSKKSKGGLSSPMTPIFPTPSPQELAGGSDRMGGEFGQGPAGGVIRTVITTNATGTPAAPMSTPFEHPIAKGKK